MPISNCHLHMARTPVKENLGKDTPITPLIRHIFQKRLIVTRAEMLLLIALIFRNLPMLSQLRLRVHRASASRAVHSGSIRSLVKPMTFELVFTASVFDAQHESDSVKNVPARLLVPLVKALRGISHLGMVER